jgi:hypothetical protein
LFIDLGKSAQLLALFSIAKKAQQLATVGGDHRGRSLPLRLTKFTETECPSALKRGCPNSSTGSLPFVISAQAGIQDFFGRAVQAKMDAGLRRHDKPSLHLKARCCNLPQKEH